GSIQVARKLLPTIWRADVPLGVKLEAFFHLTNNIAYPLLLVLSLLLLPNLAFRTQHGIREVLLIDLPLFFGTTLSIASFYLASQREIDPTNWRGAPNRRPPAWLPGPRRGGAPTGGRGGGPCGARAGRGWAPPDCAHGTPGG